MAANTNIEWATHTFNFWRGCQHAVLPDGSEHPGCGHCYAETMSKRNPKALGTWGADGTRVYAAPNYRNMPLKWNKYAEADGTRPRVFCLSLGDVFEDWPGHISTHDADDCFTCSECGYTGCWPLINSEFRGGLGCPNCPAVNSNRPATMADLRRHLFRLIDATPNLDWLLLTKRPENIRRMWLSTTPNMPDYFRPNVWLGTSISDQATADRNVPELLKCRELSPCLFLSAEPLLGEVNLEANRMGVGPWHEEPWMGGINWIIVGGESGPHARPCVVEYAHDLVYQCRAANVPVFVKQMGAMPVSTNVNLYDWPEHVAIKDWGDAAASGRFVLRDKKGGNWNEWPADLRVREFPEVEAAKSESDER